MIELYTANTPNGKKISIMLEEIGYEYNVNTIDLNKGDQFNPEFKKISPFSKIPVIVDHSNNKEAIFESGAILMYLGEKSGQFYNKKNRNVINKPEIKKSIMLASKLIKGSGRILVRKSGTESKIRIMGESENKRILIKCVNIILKKIK